MSRRVVVGRMTTYDSDPAKEEPVAEEEEVYLEDLTNDELREMLAGQGLATSGTKAELIERLKESEGVEVEVDEAEEGAPNPSTDLG